MAQKCEGGHCNYTVLLCVSLGCKISVKVDAHRLTKKSQKYGNHPRVLIDDISISSRTNHLLRELAPFCSRVSHFLCMQLTKNEQDSYEVRHKLTS